MFFILRMNGIPLHIRKRLFSAVSVSLLLIFFKGFAETQDESLSDPSPYFKPASIMGAPDDESPLEPSLREMSEESLREIVLQFFQTPHYRSLRGYEPCLLEMQRRGGKVWETFLQKTYRDLSRRMVEIHPDLEEIPGNLYALEMLTVLRRLQGNVDPLAVEVDVGQRLIIRNGQLPRIPVALRNVDVGKEAVGFTAGGNYRSGRQARWRVELRNEAGEALPMLEYGFGMGGGIFSELMLEPGKSWETQLELRNFISLPPPGTYTMRVQYHNFRVIASLDELDDLVFFQSDPIPVRVERISIPHREGLHSDVMNLLNELDPKAPINLVAGTYGEWAHDFLAPDTIQAQILSMGLPAVPTLIQALEQQDLSPRKKAHVFALLFSLTGEHDPRNTTALGNCNYVSRGWSIWGGMENQSGAGGLSGREKGSIRNKRITDKAQDLLTSTWRGWLQTFVEIQP